MDLRETRQLRPGATETQQQQQQEPKPGFGASKFRGFAVAHLAVAVVRLLQLQVFSGLAGEIHPLPFEPFDGGLLQQRLRVHSGHKRDVLTCSEQFVIAFVRINQDFQNVVATDLR